MSEEIKLAPRLDLSAANALMAEVSDKGDVDIVFDFAEVKNLGTLCMQVMLSAATTANTNGRSITLTNTSDRVIDQMRVMGMTPEAISRGRI